MPVPYPWAQPSKMFRRSHAPTFFSHGQRCSSWRLPRWLWLLLLLGRSAAFRLHAARGPAPLQMSGVRAAPKSCLTRAWVLGKASVSRRRDATLSMAGLLLGLMLGLALTLAGCSSVAPQRSAAPTASTAPPTPAPASPGPNARTQAAEALAIEQQWLQDWFRGTPVRIGLRSDGSLAIEVPRDFSFDAGRSQAKPALLAVLDKVAQSLMRRTSARLTLLAAPSDPGSAADPKTLALQRANVIQRHLRDRGVALVRLAEPQAAGGAAVLLRMDMPTP